MILKVVNFINRENKFLLILKKYNNFEMIKIYLFNA